MSKSKWNPNTALGSEYRWMTEERNNKSFIFLLSIAKENET